MECLRLCTYVLEVCIDQQRFCLIVRMQEQAEPEELKAEQGEDVSKLDRTVEKSVCFVSKMHLS